jgi:cytochrome c6
VRSLALALLVLALAGCGGSSDGGGGDTASGKELFSSAGCGACHTLSAAGTGGSAGPDLDETDVGSAADVEQIVRQGGREMPSFAGRLTDDEIAEVAAFVAGTAGGGTAAGRPRPPT